MNLSARYRSAPFFFTLLFLTHCLASLSVFSIPTRQWIWIGGTLTAFFWMIRKGNEYVESLFDSELKEKGFYPPWVWALLITAGLFLRSLRFWAFPHWPLLDEASIIQGASGGEPALGLEIFLYRRTNSAGFDLGHWVSYENF